MAAHLPAWIPQKKTWAHRISNSFSLAPEFLWPGKWARLPAGEIADDKNRIPQSWFRE
jgi:hypothetical protein